MATAAARALYDMDYVDGGCVGDPPAGSAVDDTFGTYSSDYAIGVIGLVAAAALALNPRVARLHKLVGAGFFAATALGYGLAGWLHQVEDEESKVEEHFALWAVSLILTLLGSLALGLLANQLLFDRFGQISVRAAKVLNGIVVLLISAAIVVTAVFADLLVTGLVSLFVLLYAAVVFALRREWAQASGAAIMIVGMIVQVALAPLCGDAGYADCWADCPLPAPEFNHNALFHVIYAVGLLTLAVAANVGPALAARRAKAQGPAS